MYADDTQVYISFNLKTPHEAVDTINECISDLRTWMINHKLKINDSKTEFLIICSQFSKVTLPKLSVTVGDTEISSSDKARNLGVIFDSFMNLGPHITQVCRVAYMHLSNVRKIRNMLTDEAASQLIDAFITSRIDYCNSILYGMPFTILFSCTHYRYFVICFTIFICGSAIDHSAICCYCFTWTLIRLTAASVSDIEKC